MEVWKKIDGVDKHYVSNMGRVKADAITTRFGRQYKSYPERYLKPHFSKTGYNAIDISINGIVKRFLLHRLVAHYFVPNPEKKLQVNHIDGNKNNNSYINLEWCTAAENLKHARDIGLNKSVGCDNKMAKLNAGQIIKIRLSEEKLAKIASEYSVSIATISRVKSKHIYKDVE